MVKDQIKIAPSGKIYALDIGSIAMMLNMLGYKEKELKKMIRKLRIIFEVIYEKN